MNFKNELYNDDVACVADNIDQFAKLKRSQSRQFSKAQTTSAASRYMSLHEQLMYLRHVKLLPFHFAGKTLALVSVKVQRSAQTP